MQAADACADAPAPGQAGRFFAPESRSSFSWRGNIHGDISTSNPTCFNRCCT